MEDYTFLLAIALVLLSTKILGLASEKVHMPQVVGALVAGVILGPSGFGLIGETDFLMKAAELGVILLMFQAGLDTDLDELKQTGVASFVIALIGVIVPLLGGAGCFMLFHHDPGDPKNLIKALFVGVVLTATSVSITVETLREMGKLKSRVGTAILGAAVIDDILGIIVLTVMTGMVDDTVDPRKTFMSIGLFFVFVGVVGFAAYKLFKRMNKSWGQHRRIAIYALVFCLLMSFVAEEGFGIADITGAYFAGLILCNISETREYAAKKLTVMGYMLFSPLFFASIGIKTELSGMTLMLGLFAVVLTVIAILTKVVGCGIGARIMGFGTHDALAIGLGMVSRGEVALIVAQKGAQAGLIDQHLFAPIVLMVIVTTLITPILLKLGFRRDTSGSRELSPEDAARMPKTHHI